MKKSVPTLERNAKFSGCRALLTDQNDLPVTVYNYIFKKAFF